jgi:hypothetical protein
MPGPKAPGLLFAAVLLFGAATAALAFPGVPRPGLLLSAGKTFAISGEPSDGGASLSAAPVWAVGERARFGVVVFADDMGTQLVELTDPNDGTPLGTASDTHRWAWGAAWYAEADVFRATRWTCGASGEFGYWRIEDDVRGTTTAAGSALGLALGADVRRDIGGARQLGLSVCYRKLTQNQNSAWQRVDHYASAALELRWAPPQGND